MTPVVIAPPLAAVAEVAAGVADPRWVFPDTSRQELADLLASLQLPEAAFYDLLAQTRARPALEGFVITPSASTIRQLPPPARATLYRRLALDGRNLAHVNAYRYWDRSPEAWLAAARLPTQLRQQVEPLIYRQGHLLGFADLSVVLAEVKDPQARAQVVQALAAERTLMLRLHVAEGQDVEPLVRY